MTNSTIIDCPLCAPEPCIGGSHRNAMIEDGVIKPGQPAENLCSDIEEVTAAELRNCPSCGHEWARHGGLGHCAVRSLDASGNYDGDCGCTEHLAASSAFDQDEFEAWWESYQPIRTIGFAPYYDCARDAWNAARAQGKEMPTSVVSEELLSSIRSQWHGEWINALADEVVAWREFGRGLNNGL